MKKYNIFCIRLGNKQYFNDIFKHMKKEEEIRFIYTDEVMYICTEKTYDDLINKIRKILKKEQFVFQQIFENQYQYQSDTIKSWIKDIYKEEFARENLENELKSYEELLDYLEDNLEKKLAEKNKTLIEVPERSDNNNDKNQKD